MTVILAFLLIVPVIAALVALRAPASAAPAVPSRATSSADTTVVTSMATQSRARLLIIGAASIDQANMFRPA